MNYINSICDGCGLVFREDDDVVVCPECGTPQHRECYKKNNCCVNAHRHAQGFEWNALAAPKAPAFTPTAEKKEETLPCPSCGHLNDKNAKVCENCSMKLIVFGMNLAETGESLRNETPEEESSEESGYKPPFILGEGEGFDYGNMPGALREQPDAFNTPTVPPVIPTGMPPMHNVPPLEHNPKHFFLSRFIGPNSEKYINAFRKLDSGRAVTFNWAAFFFAPYWFFFRKLYKPGIIFLTVGYIIATVFSPVYVSFLTELEALRAITDANAAYEAVMQLYNAYLPQLSLIFLVETSLNVLAGLIAYPLYKKYTEKNLQSISRCPSPEIASQMLSRAGGSSLFAPALAWCALSFIESIISFITEGGSIF